MQHQKIVRPCKPLKLNYVVYKELRNISAKSFKQISRGCRKKLEYFKVSRMIYFCTRGPQTCVILECIKRPCI